ncbi:hypothetical protein EAC10_23380, partial [Salmonella enterica]|nr:hypothetical protein [Salmonella enterica]
LSGLGITDERIQAAYEKQKDKNNKKTLEEIEFDIITQETEKQKNKVDFESDINNFVNYCAQKTLLSNEFDFKSLMNFKKNFSLFSRFAENSYDDEIFDISSYRRYYIDNDRFIDYPEALMLMRASNDPALKTHSFYRFTQLENYSQNKGLREKTRQAKSLLEKSKMESRSE